MISVIISSKEEPKTIRRAVEAVLKQLSGHDEVLVVAPDQATLDAVPRELRVRTIQDEKKGKPAALNMAIAQAKGETLVFTDGDVYIGGHALLPLLKPFVDSSVGAVSGRPVPQQDRSTKHGFWAHFLTGAAHKMRTQQFRSKKFIECSGYLMAVRKSLIDEIPEEALLDDSVLSYMVWEKKAEIAYASDAKVFVKFSTNSKDWIVQKTRTLGGFSQNFMRNKPRMRSFWSEVAGVVDVARYPNTPKEFWWLVQLIALRLYVWLRAVVHVKWKQQSREQLWRRVDSTK